MMTSHLSAQCPLCGSSAELVFKAAGRIYHQCGQCSGVFLDQACWLPRETEKSRYEKHNNDVNDPGYQKFVAPFVAKVQERFTSKHKGLDYGAGPGPVVAQMLRDQGYAVELYDPYFCNSPRVLQKTYDFIVCCEVIEHFNAPAKEFQRLKSLLNPGGGLFCMTDMYSEDKDFKNWYYKNDPTHVFFYHEKTLLWIKARFAFASLEYSGRIASFII